MYLSRREDPFAGQVSAIPYALDCPAELAQALRGISTFYNTYRVRLNNGNTPFDCAVEHSRLLIRSAARAEVRRFVHLSITHAWSESRPAYFRGKGLVEEARRESGMSHAILRPTVIFGGGVLIHNLAWLLRRFPLFVVPGSGEHRLPPVAVEDLTDLAVAAGVAAGNSIADAVGPEAFSFDELVRLIARAVGSRARLLHARPALAGLVGSALRDTLLTREEVEGLMASLLVSAQPPLAAIRFSSWLEPNASTLRRSYSSEREMPFR